ncbi:MAG: malto-oligosyltrehalose trehalohydrolase, partial [Tepidiformaceae bacterium]
MTAQTPARAPRNDATRWRPELGAVVDTDGVTRFRVWAPDVRDIVLVIKSGSVEREIAMTRDPDGYYEATVNDAGAGTRYGYRVDGGGPYPDPCSRRQPDGVGGPSEVVDPHAFSWTDASWAPPPFDELVISESHIGTLTPGGTFDSASERLGELRRTGFTAIELMPVASFPGRWNWGYDGAAMFAPAEVYGGPDGLRRFVDAAHRAGLAVVLDVVYNHFGPDGNYTGIYSKQYVTDRYHTPWGPAINYDGPGSEDVRAFFVENLLHWTHEYHIDGFRLDATHAIFDASPQHILAAISAAAERWPRLRTRPYLMAESHENDVRYITPRHLGGFGFDAVWADDFHHAVRSLFETQREGYFRGFRGDMRQVMMTLRHGFLFEGQFDEGVNSRRGTHARQSPWPTFIYCLQNHDQVGNRALGDRLDSVASQKDVLALTLLLLLLPQTPLLFQGQEFLASSPFLYFTDHEPELGNAVTEGRRGEFQAFSAFRDEAFRAIIPDPQAAETFERSRLRVEEGQSGVRKLAWDLHRAAIDIRANDSVLKAYRQERLPMTTRGGHHWGL